MTGPQAKQSVLLLDDDKFLLDMYSMKFSQQGYSVHASLSAHDALETLTSGFPADAILFDLVMPEHDGFSFLQDLRSRKLAPGAVLIALTNQSQDADMKKAKELGADNFIVKASMIPSEVVNIVNHEIAKKRRS
jgi:CheY-like chemotaxis protein